MQYQSEAELLAALKDSEFWKYIESYLETRRESLYIGSNELQTTEQLWKTHGAVAEITRLKNLPNLILAKMTMDLQRQQEQQARPIEDYDG